MLVPYFINRKAVKERLKKYLSFENEQFEALKLNEVCKLYDNFSISPKFLSKVNDNQSFDKSIFIKGFCNIRKKKLTQVF